MPRQHLKTAKQWVVKFGSTLVTNNGRGLDLQAIDHWSAQLAQLQRNGCHVLLVSSGAISEGMSRLGWKTRPHGLSEQQAAAAVGQAGLAQAYQTSFQKHGLLTAQVLLTHDDLANRRRYLNARSTLKHLLQLGVIPIVNENDTVANEEIRFGDNDTLAALIANLVEADVLVLLTDQDGLYDSNPELNKHAQLISIADANDLELLKAAGPSLSGLGKGGMQTKVQAAQRAARSGTTTLIAAGRENDVLLRLANGDDLGSLLKPSQAPLVARKQWLANQLTVRGKVIIDKGAALALRKAASLLAAGVTAVDGEFQRGDVIACIDPDGTEIARGLVNYSAKEIQKIHGKTSREFEQILGYIDEPELIDRDNLAITAQPLP